VSNPYQQPDPYGGYGSPQQPGYGTPPPASYGAPQQGYGYAPQDQPGYGYPPQDQPPYAQQPAFVPGPPAPQPNQLATASVALGFVSILLVCAYGGVLGLVGLGLGIAGIKRAGRTGVGRNLAIGGLVLNTLAVLITLAVVILGYVVYKSPTP
jgi:hypothetical protein